MIAAGYRTFTVRCVVASLVEVIVAVITEETSGAGNGTNSIQLNIVISLVEAMYLFEVMWLFLEFKTNLFISPRASKRGISLAERNTPIAQNFVLYSVYFALAGGYYAGYGDGFINGCLCIHSHYALEGR